MKYKVSFEITDLLQLIVFVGLYLTLTYYDTVIEWNITNDAKNTVIFNIGQQILVIVSLLLIVAGMFQNVLMRQVFCDFINSLNGIDNQVFHRYNQVSKQNTTNE